MRHPSPTLLLGVLFVAACGRAPPSSTVRPATSAPPTFTATTSSTAFALLHVTVIDVANGTAQLDRAIVIDGDRIVAVVANDAVGTYSAARTIDARGKYVIPVSGTCTCTSPTRSRAGSSWRTASRACA